MKKLLVIGGSRGIGRAVCITAIARGLTVRAMSRSGTKPVGVDKSCEVYKGNALNGADIRQALEGVDAVVTALGVPASLDLVTQPITLFSDTTRILLAEMKNADVKKLIAVTGFGAGDSKDSINILQKIPFRLVFGRAYADKSVQENLIEQSGFDWLIVRPGVLTNGPASHRYRVLNQPHEWRNGIVSRADVAEFIVERLLANHLGREKPVVIRYPF